MKILTKVFVKQILTSNSKEKLHATFLDSKTRLEQECQQLLFELRKIQHKKSSSKAQAENRFQSEINKRKKKIKEVDFKIEQLKILELGSEVIEKEVESLVEVSVGMRWDQVMNDKAIVIEDDVVVRIDEGR